MENQNKRKEALRQRIEKVLKSRDANLTDLSGKTIEEILQEVSTYHQELEFQNLELMRISEELEESERHYEELFKHAPIGYVLVDSNSTIHCLPRWLSGNPRSLNRRTLTYSFTPTSRIHTTY